jgi:hypothetical protein
VVVFNEIMYHPRDGDSIEWIELFNQMAVDVDLSGWSIEGANYAFPTNTIIGGGKYLVVANDPVALAQRFGLTNIYGPFDGKLANEGEKLRLRNHNQRIMDSMAYDSKYPWPPGPDGSGFSLSKKSPILASQSGENWTQSNQPGGTPGSANFPASIPPGSILLNEIAASTNAPFWVELVNIGSGPVDLSGSVVEFARAQDTPFTIPDGTLLGPGKYFVFYPQSYAPRSGEKVFIYNSNKTDLLDAVEIQPRTIGRSSENDNQWLFPDVQSPGASNLFKFQRDVVINEIMYGAVAGQTNTSWVELLNKGTNQVDLTGWNLSPVDYTFPGTTILTPGEYLVIAQDAAALRAKYPAIRVLGDFAKSLSHSADDLLLDDQFGNPADEVRYSDHDPWPEFADGQGASLELRDPHAANSSPAAWAASTAPGQWQSYTYSAVAASDSGPTQWNEFVFGLLDAGEVLLDDLSVIENPSGAGREILQNGGFEKGIASWRFLGTHRNATVMVDPDNPTNHVLNLVADGPTEHMHNHVETTLLNNLPIKNGTTYKISWRAKWIAGCNKLNTRLYFNRVARTTSLQRPDLIGTPGTPNSVLQTNIGPTFANLKHSPTVPKATDLVQISVRAQDPDGVKRCRLWWGVNGTNWTVAEMLANNGIYTATLPAQPAATVVQFYIEGEDNRGAISFYPPDGPASRALYKVNDGQAVSPRIHNFRLIMLPAEATALHAATNVMSNGRSLCTVIYDENEVFYNCGLHLQASERGRLDDTRVGFTVNFPADQPFRGVHDKITFDRSGGWSGRGGRQDEIVIRHIINQAGDSPDMYNDLVRVLTPLTRHTGTAMLLMSKYDSGFINGSVYPQDGSMFKLELIYYPTTSVDNDPQQPKIPQPDGVIGAEIANLGSGHEAYRWFLLAENHPGDDDYDGLIQLAQAFGLSGAALQQKTSSLLDIEQWTRVFAFKSLSGDADTYGFGLPHNQLIYVPPQGTQGKALTFPWDMDFSWSRAPTETITVGGNIGKLIHTIPANQRLYLGNLRDILNVSYNTNYMARWTAHYATLAGQNYSGVLSYIAQRANSVRGQLPALAAFAITSFAGDTFTTNATSMTLGGTAPYTFKRLQLNDDPPGADFAWPAAQSWQAVVPLNHGANIVKLVGYDFHNQPLATNQVTIISTAGLADRDGDGLPDEWELAMGLNPDRPDANEDPDGDGLNNLAEYLAGTNPLDPASTLRLSLAQINDHEFNLSFVARAYRAYRLQYRVGFGAGWSDLLTIPAAGQDRTITQPQTITKVAPALFYRLLLQSSNP